MIVYFVLSFILQVLLLLGLVVLGVYLYNMLDYEYTAFALVTDAQRTKWTIRNTIRISIAGLAFGRRKWYPMGSEPAPDRQEAEPGVMPAPAKGNK